MCFAPQWHAFFSTSQLPKVVRDRQCLALSFGHMLRATVAYTFFNISPSKSAPTLKRFAPLDFERCFAPRRVLFQDLNFQKCSKPAVFCTFWLATACVFSTSQLPKVLQRSDVFSFLSYKFASRQNGASHLCFARIGWIMPNRENFLNLVKYYPDHSKNSLANSLVHSSCIFFVCVCEVLNNQFLIFIFAFAWFLPELKD